jgi:hypothetical protein
MEDARAFPQSPDGRRRSRRRSAPHRKKSSLFSGRGHGRVVLKAAGETPRRIEGSSGEGGEGPPGHLDEPRKQIIEYYVPRVIESPPDAMRGRFLRCGEAEAEARPEGTRQGISESTLNLTTYRALNSTRSANASRVQSVSWRLA